QLTYLGVSLDSTHSGTNLAIGRVERSGRQLSLNELTANLDFARQVNPALKIKINTVVNALNADEDLSELITRVRPERWKVLRMLPIVDATLAVSDEAFAAFVERHSAFRSIQCVEDNSDMCESYLMVDPYGRFFQNQAAGEGGYLYSRPILPSGAAAAFSEMRLNPAGFRSRYTTAPGEAS
ncbi:MAG: viperin family antiviral radical SAM protein, partial [Idiomarina sp.]|nr:viperin family antiviral radical SAM protein [Idiomarina sp.]